MNTALWIIQIVLAVAFLAAGAGKLAQPREKLLERMAWAEDFSSTQVKLIGAVEVLGAIGLVLPALTGIAVWLTPLAAAGLAVTMLLAGVVHVRRGETQMVAVNVVLGLLAAVVAWQRFGPQAF